MFLLEGGGKPVDTGVAAKADGAGGVGDGVPVQVDQDWTGGELVEDVSDDSINFWGENELNASFKQGIIYWAKPRGENVQYFSIVPNASKEWTRPLSALEHGHLGERGDLVSVRTNARGGDGISQEIGIEGAKPDLGGGNFEVVRSKRERILASRAVGWGSKTMTSSMLAATCSRSLITSLMTLQNHRARRCCMTSHSKSRVWVEKPVSGMADQAFNCTYAQGFYVCT